MKFVPNRLLLLPLLAGGVLVAEARADILSGRVVNTANVGLAKVRVKIKGLNLNKIVTAANGSFSFVVPAGTYNVDFEAPTTTLTPRRVRGVRVSGATNMGTIQLVPGVPLSGFIRTSTNVGVAGGDINVYDQATGKKLFTPNDLTGSVGQFTVVIPPGTYRVRGRAARGILLAAKELRNVRVQAATTVTIVLAPGVRVTGSLVNAATNAPVVDADTDTFDALTGIKAVTPFDNTSSTGSFSFVAPKGLLHFAFDPPVGVPLVGRRIFNIPVQGNVNLGVIRLQPGRVISGRVLSNTTPVVNANIDVTPVPGRRPIYTSNDVTDSNGNFSVVVPSGNYTVSAQPSAALGLVGARTGTLAITANRTLPTFQLAKGATITGTLKAWNGQPEVGARVSVQSGSNAPIIVPQDKSDVNGHYRFVVPAGTWNVRFSTRKASFSQIEVLPNQSLTTSRVLNHQLKVAPVICFLGATGLPTVQQGTFVVANMAFFNGSGALHTSDVSMVVVDPDGKETVTLPKIRLPIPNLVSGVFGGLPLPVPRIQAKHVGKMFRYKLKFDDPATGLEFDRDGFEFIIR